ncbi:SAF domain-containing protein [Pengzhenrongella sicca]|uniref:SAF domain-containing protein n=1 Tax=Pengzhenrongella sicca TaxID=2819238 RepID=A0A8A4ZFW3_9MICO|nr:SAF domain-containing protein [Pengzhenrongella sicca]QTE30291.1 SAF domain-containing protein [Pengzhenrongella sicca]
MDTLAAEMASPVAARLRRPGWRDPRLLVGLLIIVGAMALGSWAVSTAASSTPVYLASATLTAGDRLDAADLTVAQVRLDDAEAARYLPATAAPPTGLVVLRTVQRGELVPASAVGAAGSLDVRPVPIAVADEPPAGMVPGALVDLWVIPEARDGVPAQEPHLLASALDVAEVARPSGGFAVGGTSTVHVLVPTGDLPAILGALATEGSVRVVLVPGSGG